MREIKFRAWDKESKTMLFTGFVINADGMVATITNDHDWKLEVMQYTGLKDKNDKEIYEGDIIAVKDCHYSNIDYWNNKEQKPIPFIIKWEFSSFIIPYDTYYWEIIGNIYENPDLLETPK